MIGNCLQGDSYKIRGYLGDMVGGSIAGLKRGTYVLILRLGRDHEVQIGKQGRFRFRAGFYGYVGSAFGPGGLTSRLKHHINPTTRQHWHIDYLRRVARVEQIWLAEHTVRREHDWADLIQEIYCASIPLPGFGASDCRCESHLFYFPRQPSVQLFQNHLLNRFPKDPCVRSFKANSFSR